MADAHKQSSKDPASRRSSGVPTGVVIGLLFCVAIAAGAALYFVATSFLSEDENSATRVADVTTVKPDVKIDVKTEAKTQSATNEPISPEKRQAWSNYYGNIFKGGKAAAGAGLAAVVSGGIDTSSGAAMGEPPSDFSDLERHTHDEQFAQAEQNETGKTLDGTGTQQPAAALRYIQLGQDWQGYGTNVFAESGDAQAFEELAQQEFKKAKLNQNDLTLLSSFDIAQDTVDLEARDAVSKLVRLIYYAKQLGKEEAVEVLLERVHPSIQAAVNESSELSLRAAAESQPEEPVVEVQEQQQAALQGEELQEPPQLEQQQEELQQSPPPQIEAPSVDLVLEYERGRKAANSGDFKGALRIWLPLAEQGYPKAQTAVGRLHARGDGVKRDFNTAFRWFYAAAEQGEELALLNLGKMYLRGDGVAKDKATAQRYLAMAAAKGNLEAKSLLR